MKTVASLAFLSLLLTSSAVVGSTHFHEEPGEGPRSIHVDTYEQLLAQKFKDYPPELRTHMQKSNIPLEDSIKWLTQGYQKSMREAALACTAEMETLRNGIIQQLLEANNIQRSKSIDILESQIKEAIATRREIYNDMYRGVKASVPYETQLTLNYQLLAQYGMQFIEKLASEVPGDKQPVVEKANGVFNELLKRLVDAERTREQYKKVLDDKLRQAKELERLKKLEEEIQREFEALNQPKVPKPEPKKQSSFSDWFMIEK